MNKKIIVVGLLVSSFILGACSSTVVDSNAEQNKPLKIWSENENGSYETLAVVDEKTGVNYVVVSRRDDCHHYVSVSVTPRLNANGTPYTSK